MVEIPVIDFSDFRNGDKTAKQNVAAKIYQACHEIGFMYLRNQGISQDILEQIFSKSKSLFDLPLEVKQQFAWSDEYSNQGYVGIERERLNPNQPGDLKEAFNVSSYNMADVIDKLSTTSVTKSVAAFYDICTELANQVLEAIALALELPTDFFATNHNQKKHTLRLLHYPPLQEPPKPGQVRTGEHSDYGSITLLFQDDVGGLEVQTTSGKWIAAPAIPGTVIVNTGDLMQRWTNHVFCSTKHRVMIPQDSRVNKSRYSIAFFCHPNDDTEIACLESCKQDNSPLYPPILAGEYLLSRLQATY
jgi:isopenicillin N synthase-like dioxygenase